MPTRTLGQKSEFNHKQKLTLLLKLQSENEAEYILTRLFKSDFLIRFLFQSTDNFFFYTIVCSL